MDKQEQEVLVQNQLTLMNDCFQCLQLNELCGECLEAKDVRDAIIANEMVEDGMAVPEVSPVQEEPPAAEEIPIGEEHPSGEEPAAGETPEM